MSTWQTLGWGAVGRVSRAEKRHRTCVGVEEHVMATGHQQMDSVLFHIFALESSVDSYINKCIGRQRFCLYTCYFSNETLTHSREMGYLNRKGKDTVFRAPALCQALDKNGVQKCEIV